VGERSVTYCPACGGDAGARCHATITMKVEPTDEKLMAWRISSFAAHKFLSRLLGVDLNQAVAEADARWGHPLGLDEEWRGTHAEWVRANERILLGALNRLRANLRDLEAGRPCACAECSGEEIDLDAERKVRDAE
jgi:hypothetical protein